MLGTTIWGLNSMPKQSTRYLHRHVLRAVLFCAILTSAAQADLLYDVQGFISPGVTPLPLQFTFTEPQFLTSTTTIAAADLNIILQPSPCNITSATLSNPSLGAPSLTELLTGSGCTIDNSTTSFSGPLDHTGVFSNGAPVPTTITITGSPAAAVPEPASVTLLAWIALLCGWRFTRKTGASR